MSERRNLFLRLWPLLVLQNGLLAALALHLSPQPSTAMMAASAAGVIVLPVAMAMMATRIANPLPDPRSLPTAPAAIAVRQDPSRRSERRPIALVSASKAADVVAFSPEKHSGRNAAMLEAEDNQFAINVIDAGLRRLAAADLSTRLETPLPEEFEGMRGDFNRALRLLDDSVAAIGRSAGRLHGECSEARFRLDQQRMTNIDDTPILTAARDGLKDTSAAIRSQVTGLMQISAMAGNAAARLEDQGEAAKAAATALTDLAGSNGRISSAASSMRDIAFRTNMLSVNASVAAANGATSEDALKSFALELRDLAESVAAVAREASLLERDLGLSAAAARSSIDRLVREGDMVSTGLETIETRISAISDAFEAPTAMIDRTGAVVEEMMASKVQRSASDGEWESMVDRMTHELAMINQHCGRFMKVTVLHESPTPEDRPPRTRSHLRLIKT